MKTAGQHISDETTGVILRAEQAGYDVGVALRTALSWIEGGMACNELFLPENIGQVRHVSRQAFQEW